MRRLLVLALAVLGSLAFAGCEPPLCTQLEVGLGAPGCGEKATLNSPPEVTFESPPGVVVNADHLFRVKVKDPDKDSLWLEWDLDGDGDYERADHASGHGLAWEEVHQRYTRPGVYTVSVRVSDFPKLGGGEGVTTEKRRLRVFTHEQYERNQPPVAVATVSPSHAEPGTPLLLDASGSTDPEGGPLSYVWFDWVSGPRSTFPTLGVQPTWTHTFTETGHYETFVRVTDEYAKYDDQIVSVDVRQPSVAPVAALDIEPNPVIENDAVTFSARRSTDPNNDIYSFQWDLDGVSGYEVQTNGYTTTHRYGSAGEYPVSLRVVDIAGHTSTATGTVRVEPRNPGTGSPPTAVLGIDPNPGRVGSPIAFTASASTDPDNDIDLYEWDIDGVPGYEVQTRTPFYQHTYSSQQALTVQLRVTDERGHPSIASQMLYVVNAPPAGLAARPQAARAAARAKSPVRRPFSARVAGKAGDVNGSALTGVGSLRARLTGSRLTKAERLMKRFLAANWRTKADVSVNPATRSATVRGTALVTPRTGGRACVRLTLTLRAGELPTGRFRILGGSGSAAKLYGDAEFRFQVRPGQQAAILGTLRASRGKARRLPARCG